MKMEGRREGKGRKEGGREGEREKGGREGGGKEGREEEVSNNIVFLSPCVFGEKVVEDGYEFFARRQLVTLFSAPNYCGDYDNAGGMMTVSEQLFCSFQVCVCMCVSVCV